MFKPKFTITNSIANMLTTIERARGFLEAATLSDEWVAKMQNKAVILEVHHTTHIEGKHLTLEQSEQLWAGQSCNRKSRYKGIIKLPTGIRLSCQLCG